MLLNEWLSKRLESIEEVTEIWCLKDALKIPNRLVPTVGISEVW